MSRRALRTRQALRFLAVVSAPYLGNSICRDRLIQRQDVLPLRARFYVAGIHLQLRAHQVCIYGGQGAFIG